MGSRFLEVFQLGADEFCGLQIVVAGKVKEKAVGFGANFFQIVVDNHAFNTFPERRTNIL